MTVFLLESDRGLAICKRPGRGLLAGLWEFPHVPGKLEAAQALEAAEKLGVRPTELQQVVERRHIFTHVEWDMRGYYLLCEAGGDFTWATREALAGVYALPTAFRSFCRRTCRGGSPSRPATVRSLRRRVDQRSTPTGCTPPPK